jgi:hypothetical protein
MRAPTAWPRNRRCKSIVDPARATAPAGPHFFRYRGDEHAVTENCEPVRINEMGRLRLFARRILSHVPLLSVDPYTTRRSLVRNVSVERLRINHYVVKSREEFASKFKDRRLTAAEKRRYFVYHDRNEVADPILLARVPDLREWLSGTRDDPYRKMKIP